MARNKVPGTDGFPVEYYEAYRATLAPKLLVVYHDAHQWGILPDSLREALIVVLPQYGRDPLEVSSYHPLSMLNIDYKILSKVLANRLLPLLSTLVGLYPAEQPTTTHAVCATSWEQWK